MRGIEVKMSARQFDIMVAGHLCLDLIPQFGDILAHRVGEILSPGKLVQLKQCLISTGGTVSNTGSVLKKLGNKVCFCARVGDDELGRLTFERLRYSGGTEGINIARGDHSSYTLVLAMPGIDRIFLHSPGSNDRFSAADLDPEMIKQCRHFHFGYPPLMRRMFEDEGRELQRIFRLAKQAGATTSCDMALMDPCSPAGRAPWKVIMGRVLPYVDIFLPSIEEAFYMLEPVEFLKMKRVHADGDLIRILKPSEYTRIAGELLAFGAKMTSLKAGSRGFYFRTQAHGVLEKLGGNSSVDLDIWSARELWCPAFRCRRIASATGSGDCSIAGFLSGFVRGLSIEKTLKVAACLGWQNLHAPDSTSGVRTWTKTMRLLRQGMPMIRSEWNEPGWAWNDSVKMWVGPCDRSLSNMQGRNSVVSNKTRGPLRTEEERDLE